MKPFFQGKRVLVTGGCGTVGSQLVHQLIKGDYDPMEVVVLETHEQSLFFMHHKYAGHRNLTCVLGDIRDESKLTKIMHGIDIVFHTAAFKHVFLCETSPFEAVQTNITGTHNLISAAMENKVRTVIFTSSDKAVNPTNVMGASKLMAERLISSANIQNKASDLTFSSVRFCNILGSSGSVVPIFQSQISKGGPVTLTHPDMTRFIMNIRHAVQLILDATVLARGGEIFITKMPVARISDLARVMIDKLSPRQGIDPGDIRIDIIGSMPGEKMYEELMTTEEATHSIELRRYFVVLPALRGFYRNRTFDYPDVVSPPIQKTYISSTEHPLSYDELSAFLDESGFLTPPEPSTVDEIQHRQWPGEGK
jgi:FlaA1/EpsC-like NDP-sugar epimerase